MLHRFLATVYFLAGHHRWDDLHEYFALIHEIINRPDDSGDLANLTASLKESDDALAASVAANQPK